VHPYCAVPIMCSSGTYLFSDAAGPDSEWPEWVDPAFTLALRPSVSIAGRRTPPRGADRVPWLFISGLRGWFPAPVSSAPDCIDPGLTFGGAGVCANAPDVTKTLATSVRRNLEDMFRFLVCSVRTEQRTLPKTEFESGSDSVTISRNRYSAPL
jgi:hypothetical protein